jgi:hypothetical protein
MRTTVSIDDHLLAEAREQARRRRQTLSQLVEDALRSLLARGALTSDRPVVPTFTGGTGPRPGVDFTSNRAIHEVLDEEMPLEQLR